MSQTGYIRVILYPQSDKEPTRAVVRDRVTGKEWEYDIPGWLQTMSRDHIKDEIIQRWKTEQESDGMIVEDLIGAVAGD